jgi:hypothetical protein
MILDSSRLLNPLDIGITSQYGHVALNLTVVDAERVAEREIK